MDELRNLVCASASRPNIIAINETWLNDNHSNDMVSLPNYTLFRQDRHNNCNDTRRGGGVALWFDHSVHVQIVTPTSIAPVGWNFICVYCYNLNLILWCVYVPPSVAASVSISENIATFLINTTDSVLSSHPDANILISGDINQMNLSSLCSNLGLHNVITEPTRGSKIIDVVLVSDRVSSSTFSVVIGAPLSTSDHKSIFFNPIKVSSHITNTYKVVYDSRESNLVEFERQISISDWSFMYDTNKSLDDKCCAFHSAINKAVHKSIPSHVVSYSDKDKPWITPVTKHLINQRWNAFALAIFLSTITLKRKSSKKLRKANLSGPKNLNTMPSPLGTLLMCFLARTPLILWLAFITLFRVFRTPLKQSTYTLALSLPTLLNHSSTSLMMANGVPR